MNGSEEEWSLSKPKFGTITTSKACPASSQVVQQVKDLTLSLLWLGTGSLLSLAWERLHGMGMPPAPPKISRNVVLPQEQLPPADLLVGHVVPPRKAFPLRRVWGWCPEMVTPLSSRQGLGEERLLPGA